MVSTSFVTEYIFMQLCLALFACKFISGANIDIDRLHMGYGVVVSTYGLHRGDRGSNPGNRLFLCPLDVLNVLYCHQSVPCVVVN